MRLSSWINKIAETVQYIGAFLVRGLKVHGLIRKIPRKQRVYYWSGLAVIILYIVGGIIIGYQIYTQHSRSKTVRTFLSIYPFPALIVDGSFISVGTAYKQIDYIEHFGQKSNQQVGSPDEIRAKVLDRFIEQAIIDGAAKDARLRVTEKEINEALDKVYQDNGGEKPVSEVLQSLYGMTVPEFKKLIRDQLLKQKFKENALIRVGIRHILLTDENKAKEVLGKVAGGGNFEELAKEFSQDSKSRDKGGELGWVNRGQLPKEVEEVAFILKPGEIHPNLIKSQFGYHIIRVDGRNNGTIDLSYENYISQYKEKHRIIQFLK